MFVSVSNPDGIQHHGGQMAWDAVSDDRVVMMTYTKDNKALIQEINNVGGAPTVGPASFIAPADGLINSASYAHHLRPKICAVKGTDKVVAIVPSSFQSAHAASGSATLAGILNAATYLQRAAGEVSVDQPYPAMPVTYTAYLLQRDSTGLYRVIDNVPLPNNSYNGTTWDKRAAIAMENINATTVCVRFYHIAGTRQVGGLLSAQHTLTISADGKLSLSTTASTVVPASGPAIYYAYQSKKTRDRKGVYSDMIMFSNLDGQPIAAQSTWLYQTSSIRPGALGGASDAYSGQASGDTNNRATLGSHVPVDKSVAGSYYATGHNLAGSNTLYKNPTFTYLGNTKAVYCPIDTGFVTPDIICVVGGTDTYVTYAAEQTAQNDVDLAYSIASKVKGEVLPLRLSFRMITGSGHYAGPYDPVTLPYWYATTTNNSEILHKVSDTNFWLIGCWMQTQNAEPQIGVISVKPPAA